MKEELRNHMIEFLEEGMRYDGRDPLEYRDVSVETGVSKSAEGSARVKIGDTEVLAGIKMSTGEPYPDVPEQGTIIVNCELLALSNPEYEPGPPRKPAIEIARVIDRGIRESGALDFKDLSIKKGELCWLLHIDIISMNDDGNLLDAGSLAALAALKDAKFPTLDDDNKIDYKNLTDKDIPLKKEPVEVTVLKIGDHFIVDPTLQEEEVLDARLTVAFAGDGNICALQKGGESPLSSKDINKMVDIASKKEKVLRKALSD